MIFELNIINMYTLQQFAGFRFQSVIYLGSSHVDLYKFPVCYQGRSIYSRLHVGLCFQYVIWSVLFILVYTLVFVQVGVIDYKRGKNKALSVGC